MCDLIGFGWENHCGLHLFFYFGYRFFLTKMRDYGVLFDDKNDNTPLLVHILYRTDVWFGRFFWRFTFQFPFNGVLLCVCNRWKMKVLKENRQVLLVIKLSMDGNENENCMRNIFWNQTFFFRFFEFLLLDSHETFFYNLPS
jgi:hypothetical protein